MPTSQKPDPLDDPDSPEFAAALSRHQSKVAAGDFGIDSLLADCPTNTRPSMVGDNKPLADAIEAFLDLKVAGDERVLGLALSWFYREKLQAQFDGPVWFGTVRTYVRQVLKRDHNTGKVL